MGSVLSFFNNENPIFTYNGNALHAEASEALDAAIASHLREIGAGTAIPIRNETPKEVYVPIGLHSPAFVHIDDKELTISFASSIPGKMLVLSADEQQKYEEFSFNSSDNQTISFKRPDDERFTISFTFDNGNDISARVFTFSMHGNSEPIAIEDKLVIHGRVSTISKIYGQEGAIIDQNSDDSLCLICYSEKANVVALPCRHCCMCRHCAERFANLSMNCPICRTHVNELVELIDNKPVK